MLLNLFIMKNIILIFTISILLFSCKKDNSITHTLSGQYIYCNGVVYTGDFELYQEKSGSNSSGQILATTKTDSLGNFSFTYSTDNTQDKLILRTSSGFGYNKVLEGIDIGDISNLKIYNTHRYHLIVSLNITKPYTSSDTLFLQSYTNAYPNGIKIVGPFVSGRVYVATNLYVGTPTSAPNYSGNLHTYYCGLNSPYELTGAFSKDYIVPKPTKCSGDSVYVSLDIK